MSDAPLPGGTRDPAPSTALEELVRWVAAGGEWRLLSMGKQVRVSLVTCDGGEEMGRLESSEPGFLAYIAARSSSTPED